MKKKNAFTLVEMLSVVVILGITFMFVIPSLTELFTMGNKTETELIEERVLSAAKEYVNNIDGTFYTKLYKEGDTNYIYKSDLINAGLITNEEISKLNTFAGVKGEVIKNDRIRYTVEYINASNNEYTNEELYLMIKNMQNQSGNSSEIDNLKSRIEELEETSANNTKVNDIGDKVDDLVNKFNNFETSMSMLKIYPVGSVYVSTVSTSPADLFGGTWEQLKDRFLLGAGDNYIAGSTGGESKHTLTVNEMPSHSHEMSQNNASTHENATTFSSYTPYSSFHTSSFTGWQTWTTSEGGSQPHNNMPPYLTVYMWKRTA